MRSTSFLEPQLPLMGWSGRAPALPAANADRGHRRQGACALISMMARSTCSNQRPNTLTQDHISQRRTKPLAPHGGCSVELLEYRPVKVKRSNGRGALSCFSALLLELPR